MKYLSPFWQSMESNKNNPQKVTLDLNRLSMVEFASFSRQLKKYLLEIRQHEEFICNFIINNGFHATDDGLEYFIYNLIFRGIDLYTATINDNEDDLLKAINKFEYPKMVMYEQWDTIFPEVYMLKTVEDIDQILTILKDIDLYTDKMTKFYKWIN